MLTKEYRIPMPLTTTEYKIGQLYMIAKHSNEQSCTGEGVEVCANHPYEDAKYGAGQFTEKRIHLSSRLPPWIRSMIPRIFYVTEKAWNYYPHTITEYTCSFLPKFIINIQTSYEDNSGTSENAVNATQDLLDSREVDFVDIAFDDILPKHYKIEEDLKLWKSTKTGRGPLEPGWLKNDSQPMMCSYKFVSASFEVWGLQTRVEDYVQKVVREVLLVGHRQAVAWLDQWIHMNEADVRQYEQEMSAATNEKVLIQQETEVKAETEEEEQFQTPSALESPNKRGWFNWS